MSGIQGTISLQIPTMFNACVFMGAMKCTLDLNNFFKSTVERDKVEGTVAMALADCLSILEKEQNKSNYVILFFSQGKIFD